MSILFDDGSNEYLAYAGAVVSVTPLTMAAWVYPDNVDLSLTIMGIYDASSYEFWKLSVAGNLSFDKISLRTYDGVNSEIWSTTGTTINTWHHACATEESATSRSVYIDGGSKSTDATNITPDTLDVTEIGSYAAAGSRSLYFSGMIAEAAIWSIALSDAEVALLAKGFSPLFFQPEDLISYWPLMALEDINDRIGDANMTAYNAPLTAVHPPKIIYPSPPMLNYLATTVAPEVAENIPLITRHLATLRGE